MAVSVLQAGAVGWRVCIQTASGLGPCVTVAEGQTATLQIFQSEIINAAFTGVSGFGTIHIGSNSFANLGQGGARVNPPGGTDQVPVFGEIQGRRTGTVFITGPQGAPTQGVSPGVAVAPTAAIAAIAAVPPPSNPLDILGFLKNIADAISNLVTSITKAATDIGNAIGKAITQSFEALFGSFIKEATAFFSGILKFFTDPTEFIRVAVKGVFSEASPSIATDALVGIENLFFNGLNTVISADLAFLQDQVKGLITTLIQPFVAEFRAIVSTAGESPTEVEKKLIDLKLKFEAQVLGLMYALEAATGGQVEALSTIFSVFEQTFPLNESVKQLQDARIGASYAELARHSANREFRIGIPGALEAIQMFKHDRITLEKMVDFIIDDRGLDTRKATDLFKTSLAQPFLADFFTFNLRHPDKAKSISDIANIADIDYERFPEIFDEREWDDISIRQLPILYDLGKITKDQVRNHLRRLRFRSDVLPGQDVSDLELMTSLVTEREVIVSARQRLSTTRRAFILGFRSQDQLSADAKRVFRTTEAVENYVQSAITLRDIRDETVKRFSPNLLATLLADDIIDDPFVNEDIDASRTDDAHKRALKDYVALKAKQKAAKLTKTP